MVANVPNPFAPLLKSFSIQSHRRSAMEMHKVAVTTVLCGILVSQNIAAAEHADAKKQNPPNKAEATRCVTSTGSRIPTNLGACSARGRSFSADDIQMTGATTVAQALRLLDPSVTIGR